MSNGVTGGALMFFAASVLVGGAAHARGPRIHQFGPTGSHGSLAKNTIKVTKVDKGSPADGRIKPGMVVIGAGTSKFKTHVRRELADAIDVAETEEAGGKLTLILKDEKKVVLTLEVLGTYSDTAPYNCPKTEAILKRAERFAGGKDRFHLSKLARMALHGKPKDRGQAEGDELVEDGNPLSGPPQLLKNRIYCTWDWGYQLIAACEHYLLTGDKSALPGIRGMAVTLAKGQDAGGLYGHQLATPERNGRLPGYAQMNQPSLTCFMGMILAQKCGVDDPSLNEAVERTHAFYASFIGRGAFNYGVHGPNTKTTWTLWSVSSRLTVSSFRPNCATDCASNCARSACYERVRPAQIGSLWPDPGTHTRL